MYIQPDSAVTFHDFSENKEVEYKSGFQQLMFIKEIYNTITINDDVVDKIAKTLIYYAQLFLLKGEIKADKLIYDIIDLCVIDKKL
jgi:hypothetical protein